MLDGHRHLGVGGGAEDRRPGQVDPARGLWTAGVALALIHAVVAFDVAYEWSHEAARMDTARRTAAVTGVGWGGGIFVNYLFLALWVADVVVVVDRAGRVPVGRSSSSGRAWRSFFSCSSTGAIVLAGNAARAVGGIPAVVAVCTPGCWMSWIHSACT